MVGYCDLWPPDEETTWGMSANLVLDYSVGGSVQMIFCPCMWMWIASRAQHSGEWPMPFIKGTHRMQRCASREGGSNAMRKYDHLWKEWIKRYHALLWGYRHRKTQLSHEHYRYNHSDRGVQSEEAAIWVTEEDAAHLLMDTNRVLRMMHWNLPKHAIMWNLS